METSSNKGTGGACLEAATWDTPVSCGPASTLDLEPPEAEGPSYVCVYGCFLMRQEEEERELEWWRRLGKTFYHGKFGKNWLINRPQGDALHTQVTAVLVLQTIARFFFPLTIFMERHLPIYINTSPH